MEQGAPPLAKFKLPIVMTASLFAAYVSYDVALVALGSGLLLSVALAFAAFILFGFIQGAMPILNFFGLPLMSFFSDSLGNWGYWLGGVSLGIFLLTQFHFVKPVK